MLSIAETSPAEDVGIEGWLVSVEGAITVALDTAMSPELLSEGMAREFVNRVQNLRKDSGFDVTDRIAIYLASESREILDAVNAILRFYQTGKTSVNHISTDELSSSDGTSTEFDILGYSTTVSLVRTR